MTNPEYEVFSVKSDVCDAWVAGVKNADVEYSYGGTRMVPPHFSDEEAEDALVRLMFEESHLKNQLINVVLDTDLLSDLESQLPPNYLKSRVGGGRCIMRPKAQYFDIMQDPESQDFSKVISEVFKVIGGHLNSLGGKLKLTPDFGRFEGLADELQKFTDQVLGVRCEIGGCGGKASYTTSGILGGLRSVDVIGKNGNDDKDARYTLIGSAGALGSGVLEYMMGSGYQDLAVCDLDYDNGKQQVPDSLPKLESKAGEFTDHCLERGGTLIMTTYGEEIENSNWDKIPAETNLMLAHNLSMPTGDGGLELSQKIKDRGIFCLPGQMLTLGGALTSRMEWFFRQAYPGEDFTPRKPLAHKVSERMVGHIVGEIVKRAKKEGKTPYQAMWDYAGS